MLLARLPRPLPSRLPLAVAVAAGVCGAADPCVTSHCRPQMSRRRPRLARPPIAGVWLGWLLAGLVLPRLARGGCRVVCGGMVVATVA